MNKTDKAEKFVRCVAKKKYVKANEVLEALLREKIDKRVEEVLSTQSKNS